jgi:hypothetical protein
MPDFLEILREGLTLFRLAGLFFTLAYNPARDAALSVAPNDRERGEWLTAIEATRAAWIRAYERRDTRSPLARASASSDSTRGVP